MNFTDWIGTVGVLLLLAAYFLNLFKIIPSDKPSYIIMNILGAFLSCYASVLLKYTPFIILEITWALVSLFGLIKYYKK